MATNTVGEIRETVPLGTVAQWQHEAELVLLLLLLDGLFNYFLFL